MYSIKGTFSETNIPAGVSQVTFTVDYEKRVNGGAWEQLRASSTSNVSVVNGTAANDTGFMPAGSPPVSGEEWRVQVTSVYTTGMPPNLNTVTINKDSAAMTP